MIAYKLFTKRRDGSLGPLFINRSQKVPVGKWLWAGDHPTTGFAHRPGWHAAGAPVAPHLKLLPDRVWCRVELKFVEAIDRPRAQGGQWFLARRMKVLEELTQ